MYTARKKLSDIAACILVCLFRTLKQLVTSDRSVTWHVATQRVLHIETFEVI